MGFQVCLELGQPDLHRGAARAGVGLDVLGEGPRESRRFTDTGFHPPRFLKARPPITHSPSPEPLSKIFHRALACRRTVARAIIRPAMRPLPELSKRLEKAVNRQRLLDTAFQLVSPPSHTGTAGSAAHSLAEMLYNARFPGQPGLARHPQAPALAGP